MHSFSPSNSSSVKDIIGDMVDAPPPNLLDDLQALIRQPSMSSTGEGLEKCANLIAKIMLKNGIASELLYLDDRSAPIVYAERKSKKNPDGRTLLFYNHYDVQPVEPYDQWREHPFSGTIKGNRIFGRGSADDKGELMIRISAIGDLI